jgi:predicted RNA-binding Zn ribbon-like protein
VSVKEKPRDYQYDLSGGHLALDFANTVSWRHAPDRNVDHLVSFQDLLSFALQTHLISTREAQSLREHAQLNLAKAAEIVRSAIEIREAFFGAFDSLARGKAAPPQDMALIEGAALEAMQHRRLLRSNRGYAWQWSEPNNPDRILWSIAQSAAELLTSPELNRVRECEAPDCVWLFLDTSRNHTRRWCDMNVCGNREKARRHYRRHHTQPK